MQHNITNIKKIRKDFSQNPNSSSENLKRVAGETEIILYEVYSSPYNESRFYVH
ncbi:MAG: hypothetical protein PHQ76_02990 [Caldisericia bacterium]|jgi:hypothetical protein|nr:hypothetical protein [Caldisericia bacterium]